LANAGKTTTTSSALLSGCTSLTQSEDVVDHLRALLKKAGLPDIRFHDVRRFGDCKIALKGQKVRAITF
jgi:hypothetical protein